MKHYLTGEKIMLKPATVQDREKIFLWLTKSNLTKEMMGPPNYPDSKIPSWEEFKNDYAEYYFDGSQPMNGQCFIIQVEGEDIGQINHNAIDNKNKVTDLDIWLSDAKYTGKGIGTGAIQLMCEYLGKKYGCRQIKISPSKRNEKAIRAYKKAGFVMTDIVPDKSELDYEDNVVLVKNIK
ncbi:MAG: GNAT family N-acetyltransferase [Mariniphaga sp.]|nr:GNAT family N-acetyltransferase [Mariniphaga sp.]